ncbi:hypothetical protein FA13DRAFT_1750857 [Coprinellus micaceus]|uniref:MYND-type domain-containing protein n=1 Tax=Coprinellus micaceus TaxID=71717 RepID=A0A4Y7R5D9_COPMI|nr:hypothetical protein FA13DRAFT_1750857 [Coprinellus micaceus]
MDARTFRLLRLSDELLNRPCGDVTNALAECLLEDVTCGIPPPPLNPGDANAMDVTDKAATVITQLLKVLLALFMGHPKEPMVVCRTKCYKIFLERWHNIVRWLSYFVQNASVSPRFSKVVPTCMMFLLSITTVGLEADPVAEAMVCRKDFGDFTYLLLYQEDSSTGRYYDASPSAQTSGDTRTSQSIMVIFRWLIEASDFRLNSRRHERYIYRLAAAICPMYISLLARAVSLPICLLPFTARCILRVKSPVAENYLRTATPYLYQVKTYRADDEVWGQTMVGLGLLTKCAGEVTGSLHTRRGHSVMRYAIKRIPWKGSNFRRASKCHSVAYCSAACQQADWTRLHSKECSTLARRYKDQKSIQAWPSVHRKWDILRFITAYANERFPSPKEILKVTKLSHLTRRNADPSGPTTPLLRFDPNSSVEFVDIYCHKPDELGYYTRMSLQSLYNPQAWRLESILPWLPRFQEFVDAAQQNPTTMIW